MGLRHGVYFKSLVDLRANRSPTPGMRPIAARPNYWDDIDEGSTKGGIIMQKTPKWWTNQHESAWERVKAAFKRDWDQTKHDVGGHEPNTHQHVGDTVKQAAGKEAIPPRGMPNYEEIEDAYRFGYGARSQYANRFSRWDSSLEAQLAKDWRETYTGLDWESYKAAVRRGWDCDEKSGLSKAA